MPAEAYVVHDKWAEKLHKGDVDTDTDSFEMRLYTSASNVTDTTIDDASTLTNELSGNGYSAQAVTITLTEVSGQVRFIPSAAVFNASGGIISARYAAIVDTSLTPDEIVCHSLLDDTPADLVATDGNSLTVSPNASGAYTVQRAA